MYVNIYYQKVLILRSLTVTICKLVSNASIVELRHVDGCFEQIEYKFNFICILKILVTSLSEKSQNC